MPTSRADLLEAVRAVGGRVVEELPDLLGFPVMKIKVEDNTAAIQLLNELGSRDPRDPAVVDFAHRIRGSARDELSSAQAIQGFMQTVPFILERRERFQHPLYTVRYGGDCDDHARAVKAFNNSLGIAAECEPTFSPFDLSIGHVAPRVLVRKWCWSETTCAAHWDEHPRAAGVRLGLIRPDILGAP